MRLPDQFQHIHIENCWPASDEILCQEAMQVTPKGRGGSLGHYDLPHLEKPTPQEFVDSLTPHGCLQIALRYTDPFKGCDAASVWDIHFNPPKAFRCQNRSALIESLADALLMNEQGQRNNVQIEPGLQMREQQALDVVEAMKEAYASRGTRASKRLLAEVNKALHTLTSLRARLTVEDYLRAAEVARLDAIPTLLLGDMVTAFEQYGPSAKGYRDIAVKTAIATILEQFGIGKWGGTAESKASRIRMRLQRSRKSPPS